VSTNFPVSLDSFVDPQGNQSLNNPPHSAQHANANDAILALQTKVGINNSADTTSLDYIANNAVSSDSIGEANGVAGLDGNGLVPIAELPVDNTTITLMGNYTGFAPSNSLGLNGDYAIDVSSGNVWGPKASNAWPESPAVTFSIV